MAAWSGNPCRLCLRENSKNPIPNNPLYLYSIFDASGVKVSPDDDLPQQLCDGCFLFINQSNTFRNRCQKVQKTLLDLLNKRIQHPNIHVNNTVVKSAWNPAEIHLEDIKIELIDLSHEDRFSNIVEKLNSSTDDLIIIENKNIFDGITNLESENVIENLKGDNKNRSQENLKGDNDNKSQDYEDLQPDNEYLQSDSENLQLDNENLQSDNGNLQSDNVNLQSDSENLQSDSENLQSDSENLQSDNENQQSDNVNLQSDNVNLQSDNENQQLDNEDLQSDNENLQLDNENLQSDNENLRSNNDDLNSIYEEQNLENDELQGKDIDLSSNSNLTSGLNYTINENGKDAKCSTCGKEILLVSMRKHYQRRHNLSRILLKKNSMINKTVGECDTCGKRMEKNRLVAHFLIHDLPDGKLICKHCGKKFPSPFKLLRHCRAKHGYEKVDKCSHCDFMGSSPYEVKLHAKLHKGGGLTCNVCGKTFQNKLLLWRHLEVHGYTNRQRNKSPKKTATTKNQSNIPQYEKSSSNIHSYKCPFCPHTSKNKGTIRSHMKRKHNANNTQDIIKLYKRSSVESLDRTVNMKKDSLIVKDRDVNRGVLNAENIKINVNKHKNSSMVKDGYINREGLDVVNKRISLDNIDKKIIKNIEKKVKNQKETSNLENKEVDKELIVDLNDESVSSKVKEVNIVKNRLIRTDADDSIQTLEGPSSENLKLGLKMKPENIERTSKKKKDSSMLKDKEVNKESIVVVNEESDFEVAEKAKRLIQVEADGSVQILDAPNTKNLKLGLNKTEVKNSNSYPISNVEIHNLNRNNTNIDGVDNELIHLNYDILNSGTENLRLNNENIAEDNNEISYLEYETLDSDIEDFNLGYEVFKNEVLNSNNENLNSIIENLNSNNVNLNSNNEHLNSNIENFNSNTEDLIAVKQNLNSNTEDLNPVKQNLNQDNKRLNNNTSDNNLIDHKNLDQKTGIQTANPLSRTKTVKPRAARPRTARPRTAKPKTARAKRKIKCKVCKLEILTTSMSGHLKQHAKYGDDPKQRFKKYKKAPLVECDTCGKRMLKKRLVAHFLTHDIASGSGDFICKHCGKKFDRPGHLLRHCRAKHGYEKLDKCSYCDYLGCSPYEVKFHEKQCHQGGEPFTCEKCGWSSRWRYSWLQHMAKHDNDGPKILCTECPATFHTNTKLSNHMHIYHNRSSLVRHFKCPYCPITRLLKATIKGHMKKKHDATNTEDIKTVLKNVDDKIIIYRSRKLAKNSSSLIINSEPNETIVDKEIPNRIFVKDVETINGEDFLSVFHRHLDSNKSDIQDENDISQNNHKIGDLEMELSNKIDKDLQVLDSMDFEVVNEVVITGDVHQEVNISADSNKCKCKICGKLINKYHVKRHWMKHTQTKQILKPHICEHCGQAFARKARLLAHLKFKHGYEGIHKCNYCDFLGASLQQLKQHERRHNSDTYSCKVCEKSFRYRQTLKAHMETHDNTPRKTIDCEICKKAILKQNYATHKRIHDPNYQPKQRPYVKCEVCGTEVQEHNLREHLAAHVGLRKQIPCEHCAKTFSRPSALLRHCKARHNYEKTDKCSFCDYRGCSQWEVRLHERSHSSVKPLRCQTCCKTFVNPHTYKRHLTIHQKERKGKKMFQCKKCPETFQTSRLLSTHRAEKHAKETNIVYQYKCALCLKVCQKRDSVRKHLVKVHQENSCDDKIVKLKLRYDYD